MSKRQLICYVVSVIAFAAMVVEAIAGGSAESVRIAAGTAGVAGAFFAAGHV